MLPHDSDNKNILEVVMDRIRTISSTVLSLGFVLYTIGYLIINIHLSRYAAHEIGLLEPTYLLSGVLFLVVWFIPIVVPAFVMLVLESKPYGDTDNYRIIHFASKGDAQWFWFLVLGNFLLAWIVILFLLYPTENRNGEDVFVLSLEFFLFFFIQLITVFLLFKGVFNKPFRNLHDLVPQRWQLFFFVGLSLLSIFVYIIAVFPQLSGVLGGGKPQEVCLAFSDQKAYQSMFSQVDIDLSNHWTGSLDLLFEAENSLIILKNGSTIRITKDLIASIRYNCIDLDDP
jgi:hypothetical protein